MKRSAKYWEERFRLIEQAEHDRGIAAVHDIDRQYTKAQKDIEAKLDSWYRRFADNNQISMTEARKLLTGRDLKEFKWDVNDYIRYGEENAINGRWMKELENASARVHISRLEAMKIQLQQQCEVLFGNQLDIIDSAMRGTYLDGYYRTAYEIQKGVGFGWDFGTLDQSKIDKVINKPWASDGRNFSDRVWSNKQKLVNELNTTLTQSIAQGQNPQKAIDAMSKRLNVSKSTTGRLVMTEQAAFTSAAQRDCFSELDVEQYEIVATLDSHTSDICRGMDGQHFKMSEWEVGTTAPPFHVYCRSTTVPYFDDDFGKPGERAARNEEGKTYYVPADTTYKDWSKAFVDGDKSSMKEASKSDADYMGKPETFKADALTIKAYEVSGSNGTIFTQTNSANAQKTIQLIQDGIKNKAAVSKFDRVVVSDKISIAGYEHVNKILYVSENLSDEQYVNDILSGDYFVAENADDIIKHELHHKEHWDAIRKLVDATGEKDVIIKQRIESDLRKYVAEQARMEHSYINNVVSRNAYIQYNDYDMVNELIAEVLLQEDKNTVKDERLLELVKGVLK